MSRLCVLLLLLLPVLCSLVSSVQFYLPVNSVKCLREDIHQNVLVTGEYVVSEEAKTTTDVKITDSSSYMLFTKKKTTKGVFSFTTETPDHFDICFHSTSPGGSGKVPDQLVTLNIKHGVESMTYKEIEDTEKLTPLEAKLRYLEQLAESIADDFKYLKKRGKERRQTTASTNTRVLLLSIFSMGCLSALAVWQVFYLRRFFRRKKLIE